ncbi:unnamed protein product [Rhodiola kirilowii]
MGNCLKKESTADQWGGEEWDEFLNSKTSKSSTPAPSETESRRRDNKCEKVRFDAHVEVEQEKESSKGGMKVKQVRIRISKKQLDELLGKVDLLESLKVHEMMSLLIEGLQNDDGNGQRAWRPVLKTIPELCDLNQE